LKFVNIIAAAATVILIAAKILYAIALLHECERLRMRALPHDHICMQRVQSAQSQESARLPSADFCLLPKAQGCEGFLVRRA
jgi:hypothetical protein